VEERHKRITRNEALFRAVNERIEDLSHGVGDDRVEFLCECGRESCEERILLSSGEFERAHKEDDRFVLAPGHQTEELERVVERTDRYWIVDKRSDAEKLLPDRG
jgi:diaminopimelate decarboxylase